MAKVKGGGGGDIRPNLSNETLALDETRLDLGMYMWIYLTICYVVKNIPQYINSVCGICRNIHIYFVWQASHCAHETMKYHGATCRCPSFCA